MKILFFRIIIIYLLVFAVIRLSGKRQLSQLQPFDFVITLLIADLAALPIENPQTPLSYGVVPIAVLFLLEKLIAHLVLKSKKIRKIACGSPLLIINNGKLEENTMRQANYSVLDLTEHLRTLSVFNIDDVLYAILETNGDLSVMLKPEADTPTCKDMNITRKQPILSHLLITDGEIMEKSLNAIGKNAAWLEKQLNTVGISDIKSVLYAQINDKGDLCIQTKERDDGRAFVVKSKGESE